jgi:hypothetical protein
MTFTNILDNTFSHEYLCTQLTELPGYASVPHYYYPGGTTKGGKDGYLLEIQPKNGERWYGTFAFGNMGGQLGAYGVMTTPDPKRLCVVAGGSGYFVSAYDPTAWESVQVVPILDFCLIPTHEIIVFADFTGVVAYGASGIKWKSRRISWDGIKNLRMENNLLHGDSFGPQDDQAHPFSVDVKTGVTEGGSFYSPPD